MMAKDNMLGGQAGVAESALKGRKSRLDDAIEQSEKGTAPPPKQEKPKEKEKAPESSRPPMSKKW